MSDYLSNHGIMNWDVLGAFQLGIVASPLPGDERYQGMLSIPYLTLAGPRGIRFRNLQPNWREAHPKIAQPAGQKNRLYNTAAYFAASETIGISEGEVDAICATVHLGVPTMGVPGASNWLEEWTLICKDFTTVLVFQDGDDSGREFADRVVRAIGWRARVVPFPDGEDVSSMVAAERKDELKKIIESVSEADDDED